MQDEEKQNELSEFFADINTTKGKIINVACEILKKGNYQSMTTSEIANAANISEGTIYRYFSSKKEILLTILDELNNYFVKTFFNGLDQSQNLEEKLMIIGNNFFIYKDKLVGLYSIIFNVFSEIKDEEVKQKFKLIYDKILMQISKLLYNENDIILKENTQNILASFFLCGAGELLWKLDIVNDGNILNKNLIEKMLKTIFKILEIEKNKKE
ncbi:MAG: TetR/AcrR family transcriptional regulator [Exilispira sp.]